ncbi:class I SAM-dependent methyltransferase [Stutzerimonas kirkiae]|uniref:SAM-dependent methyltransferase n=1 Tax=Stutzerimonas kirkiae TaxID=2211392 RepID=A0A4V2KCR9_9GAMM|nr:SAM-dependent methyltransferase [Stutzerimonas kirkiae]TBU96014.1 SAM-dependent methyltransferase [Stutzerimonas kirkiae]TBV03155.1 SAM-dependent methyltransferase [Stutzerimonas kirkiae]TBV09762.1 SAM-dependent methyltransferase [Stutzerimonas kirkiae]TBV13508.1 SAM-dependent methyltransferase [Stutzerimonas kirkiae]
MTDAPRLKAEPQWLSLVDAAGTWFETPHGQQLLGQERRLLQVELERCFGSYLVHYAPFAENALESSSIRHCVRLGAPLKGADIICDEQSWPLGEYAADVVVVQHGLDFSLSPHALLREAAFSVRPGGHLLVLGMNPWSAWGARRLVAAGGFRQARCIRPTRVADWLSLLGFGLEKRLFGCYCPPLSSARWQARLTPLENLGQRYQVPFGGFYLLLARKLTAGMRPLRQDRREPRGQLLPMPVAKVSRRSAE